MGRHAKKGDEASDATRKSQALDFVLNEMQTTVRFLSEGAMI